MNMKKAWGVLLAALLFLPGNSMATTVIADGQGTTLQEAEKVAMRNAVEKAVGSLIRSKTTVSMNQVLSDEIYAISEGYVKNYTLLNKKIVSDGIYVRASVEVDTSPDSKLMSTLTRLKITDVNMRNARIAVSIPLVYEYETQNNSLAETEVLKKLSAAGFQNIITSKDMESSGYQNYDTTDDSSEQMKEIADSVQADILVVGEAVCENVGDVGQFIDGENVGLLSGRVTIQAKVYMADTGQLIAVNDISGSGMDITEKGAMQKALRQAGSEMGEYLSNHMLEYFSGNRQQMRMIIRTDHMAQIQEIQQALSRVPGVQSVNCNEYRQGQGVISLIYDGSVSSLWMQLQGETHLRLQLVENTLNTITILVKDKEESK